MSGKRKTEKNSSQAKKLIQNFVNEKKPFQWPCHTERENSIQKRRRGFKKGGHVDQQWIGCESHKHFFQENMAREHLASCMQKNCSTHTEHFSVPFPLDPEIKVPSYTTQS